MPQSIEEVRSSSCLAYFRCGVREIESFAKKAYKRHNGHLPDYRVRVLYDDDDALGFHTLSLKSPDREMLDPHTVYAGSEAFLYIDHFAIRTQSQGYKHSLPLMLDVIEIAASTMSRYGRVHALSLNAANETAGSFFESWGFVAISDSTTPFMLMDRATVLRTYERIQSVAGQEAQ